MPRDSTGNATLDPIYIATPGQTILAAQHNTPLQDIQSMLTGSLARNGAGGMQAHLPMNGYRVTGMGAGTSPDDAATVAQATSNAVPVGTILDYAGRTLPDGYLWPDGRAVLRASYPELDDAIFCGNENNDTAAFGYHATSDVDPGDNRSISGTYLVLPDLRAVVSAGRSNMGGTERDLLDNFDADELGAQFGSQEHALTVPELAEHTHTVSGTAASNGAHTHSAISGGSTPGAFRPLGDGNRAEGGAFAPGTIAEAGAHTHTVSGTAAATGSGTAHNNVQPTIAMNKILRAFSV